jgi:FtsP/CotA-like multicopper oxidase with cupredoxin domain
MEQTNGRGPTGKTFSAGQGNRIMQIRVAGGTVNDPSRDMNKALADAKISGKPVFFALPDFKKADGTNNPVVMTRTFRFDRQNGQWTVNGRPFDLSTISATPKRGTSEIWVLQNNSGAWQHPLHIHFEEFQILSRNGVAPPITEKSRKDVVRLQFNEEVRFRMQFREWTGRYPFHCHNVVHEDHAMMIRWDLQP